MRNQILIWAVMVSLVLLLGMACNLSPFPLRLDADTISTVKMTEVPATVIRPEWTSYTNVDSIQDMVFDKEGQLWSASTGGVVRWNLTDQSFTKFTTEHGLGSNNVSSLAAAPDGSIWAGTSDGLSHFDGQSWSNFVPDAGSVPFKITSVAVDEQGRVWVASSSDGVWSFAEGKWRVYADTEGIYHPTLTSVIVRSNGDVCAVASRQIYCLKGEQWSLLVESENISGEAFFMEGPDGGLWLAARYQVASFDGKNWAVYGDETFDSYLNPSSLWIDSENRVWVGAGLKGPAVFDGGKWEFPLKTTRAIFYDKVASMITGADGKLWLGLERSGIYHFAGDDWKGRRLDNTVWERYSPQDNLDFPSNVEPVVAPNGVVWVADSYNLWHFENDQWTVQKSPAGKFIWFESAPAFAPDGSMWIGTMDSGVFNFDGKRWRQYTHKDGLLSDNWVDGVAVTTDGTAWFETYEVDKDDMPAAGGLSSFDGKQWNTYPWSEDGLRGSIMVAAPDGTLWMGTYDGLFHYVDGEWVNYTEAAGLPDDWIRSLAVSRDGVLWGGVDKGVFRFDGKNWQTYAIPVEVDGQTMEIAASALAIEDDGTVWAAMENWGVRYFDGRQWKSFTTRDGLGDNEVSSITIMPDGSVWFATAGGFSRYKPAAGNP